MTIEYLPTFIKDLKALRSSPVYKTIYELAFEDIPNIDNLVSVTNYSRSGVEIFETITQRDLIFIL